MDEALQEYLFIAYNLIRNEVRPSPTRTRTLEALRAALQAQGWVIIGNNDRQDGER